MGRAAASKIGWGLGWAVLVPLLAWGGLALRYSPIVGPSLAPFATVAYAAAVTGVVVKLRPWPRAWAACAVLAGAVLVAFFALRPSNDRDWAPEYAHAPRVSFDGNLVTIENVRNFDYRTETDFDERWETRSYDLSKLESVDLSLTHWGSPLIAHTIVSYGFSDGQVLAASIETRRERTEGYSAIKGFFRQFELYYVFADERDLIRLRTNYRSGEEVYLYRMQAEPERTRAVLLDYLRTANALADTPRFYNALTGNCTTSIRTHVNHSGPASPWDWRLLVNGKLPEMLYERGGLDTSVPLAELTAAGHVNERARAADQAADFSERIREGLPGTGPSESAGGA